MDGIPAIKNGWFIIAILTLSIYIYITLITYNINNIQHIGDNTKDITYNINIIYHSTYDI